MTTGNKKIDDNEEANQQTKRGATEVQFPFMAIIKKTTTQFINTRTLEKSSDRGKFLA